MTPKIGFTLVTSKDPCNKYYKSDGTKISRAQIYEGTYTTIYLSSVEQLIAGFIGFIDKHAIILGVTGKDEGMITTSKNMKEGSIQRTKKNFFYPSKSFLLIDYDPSENGYEITSPTHLVEVLRDIDVELIYCDIGVSYGSSYGIKKDGVLISNKKSFHAYIIVDNASNERVKQYKDYLVSEAWAKGYGHIELSKDGKVLRRQIFDATVFSPERLIFEATPTLEEGITRDVPKYEIFKGEVR